MRAVVVGAGLIGKKRVAALPRSTTLVGVVDNDKARAEALAAAAGGVRVFADYREAFRSVGCDVAFVCTTNDHLVPASREALEAGCHVLVEKPAATNPAEIQTLREAAIRKDRVVGVGFNHRFHRAFRQARALVDAGELGPLMFARARYGHGGRVGYDREWRADPKRAGGGELLDQGVHLIDLARWFLGDFATVAGAARTLYWDMPVEDNGFLHLETSTGQVAWLHASCTEWKNLFSFELYGRDAKLHVEGLGGSYGVERLSFYKMRPEMGPPDTMIWEYPGEDDSWRQEVAAFFAKIENPEAGRSLAVLDDAAAALSIVHDLYSRSRPNT